MRVAPILILLACSRPTSTSPVAVPQEETAPMRTPTGEIEVTVFIAGGATVLHEGAPDKLNVCRTEPMIGWVIVTADVVEDGSAKKTEIRERAGVTEIAAKCFASKLRFQPPPGGIDTVTVYIALR